MQSPGSSFSVHKKFYSIGEENNLFPLRALDFLSGALQNRPMKDRFTREKQAEVLAFALCILMGALSDE